MSRTDKDKPWWVRAEWYEPWHRCGWIRRNIHDVDPITGRFFFVETEWIYRGDCDLPEEPVVGEGVRGRCANKTLCEWSPKWPRDYNYMSRGKRKKKLRHFEFHGPMRAAERDAAREVVKGDCENEFPDGRERSSVLWDLW